MASITFKGVYMIRYEFVDYNVNQSTIHPHDVFDNERQLAFDFIIENELCGKLNNYFFKRYNIPYAFDENKNLVAHVDVEDNKLNEYFTTSELAKFRASSEYQNQITENRKNIWKSYVEWIEGRCYRYLKSTEGLKVVDLGSRIVGWVEEVKSSKILGDLSLKNTLPPIQSDYQEGNQFDVALLFNIIQRERDPLRLLKDTFDSLKEDGLLVMSFRSGTGFDVLSLRDRNKSIFPLDHLFLPSIVGIESLLDEAGFTVNEIITPGQLDAQIVKTAVEKGRCTDPMLTHLVETVPLEELQGFIQKNNLSSHVRVVAQKK